MLEELSKGSIDPETKLAYVLPTMQLGIRPSTDGIAEALEQVALNAEYAESMSDLSESELELEGEGELESTPFPNIFVIGDSADAFGAIKAGHNAYFQAEVAARNIIALTEAEVEGREPELTMYKPGPPGIKVSLGLVSRNIHSSLPTHAGY